MAVSGLWRQEGISTRPGSGTSRDVGIMLMTGLPGEELVAEGIADLRLGRETIPALLVAIGAPKLCFAAVELPCFDIPDPEQRLYDLLAVDNPDSAHSRYNALIRRLISFERSLVSGYRPKVVSGFG